jgi:hypothetical protein
VAYLSGSTPLRTGATVRLAPITGKGALSSRTSLCRIHHDGMTKLPDQFSDLEPFAAAWCLPTEPERWARRQESSIDEMRHLYEAVFSRYEAILDYVDRFPLDDLPEEARNLIHLTMSFVMVSFPVEVWNGPRIPDSGHATLDRSISPAV